MKETLIPGLQDKVEIVVDPPRTISFMGDDLRVYSTPSVVNDLEYACRDLILHHLNPGEDTVGVHVEITHLRPTPLGFTATHTIVVDSVDARRVTCNVDVHDGIEQVATAKHTRFVIDIDRVKSAVAAKRDKAGR